MNNALWTARVAGMPCTAQAATDGDWIVTVARASVGRHENLADAILIAAGGLATRTEAEALANSIHTRKLITQRTRRRR